MTDEERFQKAYEYAELMHRGQKRKGGKDYITHPLGVANIIKNLNKPIEYQITALFHDLLEDTEATEEKIEEIGGKKVLEAVKLLTKEKGYKTENYLQKIKNNEIALFVKATDRLHNVKSLVEADKKFVDKYIKETKEHYLELGVPEIDIKSAIEEIEKNMKKDKNNWWKTK